MANLYIVFKEGAIYKPGTVLRKYDEGYCRQELKPYKPGRQTYQDAGFMIDHIKLNDYVIPLNKGIKWDVTSDGVFAHSDSKKVITDNGRILGSK